MSKPRPKKLFLLTNLWLLLALVFSITFAGLFNQAGHNRAEAATSSTINFQARLLSSSGNLVPDGYYNVQFKLYSADTGGTAQWTETYYDSNGVTAGNDNRVRVVNGYLSVYLGSQTALPSIDWSQEEWLTLNIGGTTQTATPTWDGEMSPRLKLSAVPYAFTAGTLAKTTGGNTSTLDWDTQTGANSILLPDESGTLCIQSSSNCGFATGTAADYIQNGTSAQTADFNITGDGTIGGTLQADTLNATSAIELNGTDINVGGTLDNVAYLDQANTFTNTNTIKVDSSNAFRVQDAAGSTTYLGVSTSSTGSFNLGNVTSGTPYLRGTTACSGFSHYVVLNGGEGSSITLDGCSTGDTWNTTAASGAAIKIDAQGGALTLNGTTASLDSLTTGAVSIGTGTNAKTITIGNSTGATSVVLNAGTGAINIGTNTIAHTTTIGNGTGASSVVLQSGTGAINIGTNAVAHTITLGNSTGASISGRQLWHRQL